MYSMVLLMAMTPGIEMPEARGGCGGCRGGCYGCYGGCRGGGRRHGCHGCYGCYGGCYGGYGGCYGGCYGGVIYMPTVPGKQPEKIPGKPKAEGPAPATIVVSLPADAKLLIDDSPTTSTSSSRVFVSPALNPGREYHYTLTAEAVREGKPVKVEQVIAVRAGETTPVTLTLPPVGVAQR